MKDGYIESSQLGKLSTKRLFVTELASPLHFQYHIAVIHHDKLTSNLEFRIFELGLML